MAFCFKIGFWVSERSTGWPGKRFFGVANIFSLDKKSFLGLVKFDRVGLSQLSFGLSC